jgi:1-deoxy-D-xylulose-5-phosphate synthase
LRRALREAVDVDDAPTVVRYPKGALPSDVPAVAVVDGVDVLREQAGGAADVLLVSVGAMAGTCLEVAERLGEQGLGVTVVDPRWVKPLAGGLADMSAAHRVVSVVEDSGRVGGVAAAVRQLLADAGVDRPVVGFGIDQRFLDHGSRTEVLAECGLTPQDIARQLIEETARRSPRSDGGRDRLADHDFPERVR